VAPLLQGQLLTVAPQGPRLAVRCSGVEHAKCSNSLADHALSPPPKKRRRKGAAADVVNEPANGKDHKFAYIVRQNAFQRGWVCVQHAKILHAACMLPLAAVLRGFVCIHVNPLEIAAGTAIERVRNG
jgi:hypothetical protein